VKENHVARWRKRIEACKYAGVGRTKLDKLIGLGLVEARKEDGGPNAAVFVDLDSIDTYYASLRKAPGLRKIPSRKREGAHP
jgi:hypothetical protein